MHNPNSEVPESSAARLLVELRDAEGELADPANLWYEIRCLTNNTQVKALTEIPGATAKTTIQLEAADNALIDVSNSRERRSITVIANKDLAGQLLDEFRYAVLNSRSHPA